MGGGDSNTTVNQSGPPAWAQPYFQNYLNQATGVANQDYQPYTGSRVAGTNSTQNAAMDALTQRAMEGTPEQAAGRSQLTDTLSGGYLNNQAPTNANIGAANPNASVQNQSADAMNPYAGVTNQSANPVNPYAGSNPFLEQSINNAQGDVVRNYNLTAAPSYATAGAKSGSFGNAGLAEMENESRRQLAGQLGNISSGMRMQDYTQQQGLAENAANRQFQSGENVASRLFGAGQQQSQNQYASGESFANRLFNNGQTTQNQLFSGGESQAGRQQAGYENERSRQMGALGQVPAYSGMDYTDAYNLLGIGDLQQQQQQRYMDDDYSRFTDARDYPLRQLDILGRALGGANYGQTTTQQQPAGSNAGAYAGTALALASLFGGGK